MERLRLPFRLVEQVDINKSLVRFDSMSLMTVGTVAFLITIRFISDELSSVTLVDIRVTLTSAITFTRMTKINKHHCWTL
ncbi:hypothetical protein BpHYR1_007473 [Brachionus plicatilis]|uniref:Uncharacterized protein n=1 Tax=Brachionus plicatilis TaxID=10195 RepID=A0A3M7Q5C7_BRAPC|nr:hypothetical protein BpHYR1_007473 [Brachionus plicatilis]